VALVGDGIVLILEACYQADGSDKMLAMLGMDDDELSLFSSMLVLGVVVVILILPCL
jgi:hypothetical protein